MKLLTVNSQSVLCFHEGPEGITVCEQCPSGLPDICSPLFVSQDEEMLLVMTALNHLMSHVVRSEKSCLMARLPLYMYCTYQFSQISTLEVEC